MMMGNKFPQPPQLVRTGPLGIVLTDGSNCFPYLIAAVSFLTTAVGPNLAFLRSERGSFCPCFNVRNTEVWLPIFLWLTMVSSWFHQLSCSPPFPETHCGCPLPRPPVWASHGRSPEGSNSFPKVRHFGVISRVPKCHWMLEGSEPAVSGVIFKCCEKLGFCHP